MEGKAWDRGGIARALQNDLSVKSSDDVNDQTLSFVKEGDKYTWPREERV